MTDYNNKPWIRKALLGASAGIILSSLVQYEEGIRYTPYRDVGGVPTVCEGITHDIKFNHKYTPAECKFLDDASDQRDLDVVKRTVKVSLTQAQIAAFADFIHNAGAGAWERSTLLKMLNAGNIKGACYQLLRWKYAGGKVVRGLEIRRQNELQLCLGEYK